MSKRNKTTGQPKPHNRQIVYAQNSNGDENENRKLPLEILRLHAQLEAQDELRVVEVDLYMIIAKLDDHVVNYAGEALAYALDRYGNALPPKYEEYKTVARRHGLDYRIEEHAKIVEPRITSLDQAMEAHTNKDRAAFQAAIDRLKALAQILDPDQVIIYATEQKQRQDERQRAVQDAVEQTQSELERKIRTVQQEKGQIERDYTDKLAEKETELTLLQADLETAKQAEIEKLTPAELLSGQIKWAVKQIMAHDEALPLEATKMLRDRMRTADDAGQLADVQKGIYRELNTILGGAYPSQYIAKRIADKVLEVPWDNGTIRL